ncbi:putative enzyme related to lactoylglutathione lyase [Hartmannibacter diazotrophicus]|uniref:Putative enzyme related to lactoylglutathione lyase n=1 Tax=Hartmannibacter diazotrophicus TaxID=1482074 RepID=A0A2C9D9U4_9HYPH|nr:VOC family protein [Hartmannibacter diazotrophicus]SON57003.1 putative enzyme related to lactoylglutathione lyase [Hartmannibacter diazotrophicus]
MQNLSFIILYVDDVAASARFYEKLFGLKSEAGSDNFSSLALGNGLTVGLWRRDQARPTATSMPGAVELCFPVPDLAALEAAHAAVVEIGAAILQPTTEMDFGTTFTAADPDGHRLRVFHPNGA